jgi:hypothetical protein
MSDFLDLVGGYAIEQEDRAYLLESSTPAHVMSFGDLPERVDPRKHKLAAEGWLRVENQGQIGSCQGASLTECPEYCWTVATGEVIQLSKMFAYLVSQMYDRITSDRGSTLSGGTKCVTNDGICPDAIAPYPSRYPGHRWVTQAMRDAAKPYTMKTHTTMRSADEIKRYIGSGIGIVQIGISWGRAMTPDARGCIRSFAPGGGGHAVTFTGYVPDSDIGQRSTKGYWLLLKNSWGTRWGDKGFAYVDPQAVDQMLRHQWTVMIGRSDMQTPDPRPLPHDFTKPGGSMYA